MQYWTYCSEGHDSDKAEGETKGGVPVQKVRADAERYEDEHDVQPGAKKKESEGGEIGRFALRLEDVHERGGSRGATIAIR